MPTKILLVIAAVLFSMSAQAQVFKCKNAQGKIEYSDAPCAGAVETGISSNRSASTGGNPNDRVLGIYVQEAIAQKDYRRASSLAVTPEHFAMIQEAQARDEKVKAERQKYRERNNSMSCNTTHFGWTSNTTCN